MRIKDLNKLKTEDLYKIPEESMRILKKRISKCVLIFKDVFKIKRIYNFNIDISELLVTFYINRNYWDSFQSLPFHRREKGTHVELYLEDNTLSKNKLSLQVRIKFDPKDLDDPKSFENQLIIAKILD